MRAHTSSDVPPPGLLCVVEQHKDPPFERVDPSILTLIERVFGQKEVALLARMLQHADIKQYSLPESHTHNVAQIAVANVALFAQRLGTGKDTLLRHLAVYRALGLLMQRRADHQTLLSFPLAAYEPHPETTLPALDLLVRTGRPKLQQLARSVKERYQLYYCPMVLINAHPSAPSQESELAMLFLEVQQVLQAKRNSATRRQLLQMRIAAILRQLTSGGRPHQHEGDRIIMAARGRAEQGDRQGRSLREQENIYEYEGDLTTTSTEREDLPRHQGDLQATNADKQGMVMHHEGDQGSLPLFHQEDVLPQQGDQEGRTGTTSEDLSPQEGDLHLLSVFKEGNFLPQEGDLPSSNPLQRDQGEDFQTQEGDFDGGIALAAPYTYNVYFIINNLKKEKNNVIRKHIAHFFVDIFQEKLMDNGYPSFTKYLRAFKNYEPEVIGRAFLVTMVLLHRKQWHVTSRGALFINQCKVLIGQKLLTHYVLSEVEEWLQTWGHLSYAELIETLSSVVSTTQQADPAALLVDQVSYPSGEDLRLGRNHPGLLSDSHIHNSDAAGCSVESQEDTIGLSSREMRAGDGRLVPIPRSDEERKARRNATRRVREQLQQSGVVVIGRDGKDGLEVDTEHHCGCPLYRHKGLRRSCAYCAPDLSWSQEVRALIASILDA